MIVFSLCFKLLSIIINRNFCNCILIVFELFGYYFSMVSAGFLCTAAVVVYDIVLVNYELSVISMFLSTVLWKNEIGTGTVRVLVFMLGHFIFCFPSLWTPPILLAIIKLVIFCQMCKLWDLDNILKILFDKTKNMILIVFFMEPKLLKGLQTVFFHILSSFEM